MGPCFIYVVLLILGMLIFRSAIDIPDDGSRNCWVPDWKTYFFLLLLSDGMFISDLSLLTVPLAYL